MLKVKYYKDLSHNYMIIRGAEEKEDSYPYRMITENKLNNFLQCSQRKIDDESLMYYEISSKQSLRSYFGTKPFDFEQMKHLFTSVTQAILEAQGYLLHSEGILLHPDYIFYDMESKCYFFIYYPELTRSDELLSELAEFLVDCADHRDEEALETAYGIFELIQDNRFAVDGIEKLFQKTAAATERYGKREVCSSEPVRDRSETQKLEPVMKDPVMKNPVMKESEQMDDDEDDEDDELYDEEETEKQDSMQRRKSVLTITLLSVSLSGAIALCCLRYLFVLTFWESSATLLGIGVLLAAAVFLLLYLLNQIIVRKGTSGSKRKGDEEQAEAEWLPAPHEKGEKTRKERQPADTMPELLYQKRTKEEKPDGQIAKEEEEYGITTFLETALNRRDNKLYGINKGNKYHIDLATLPLTVGKLAGGVDFTIKNESISRIHARFTSEADQIFVTDLNSTNGTFKNGLRLEPHEVVLIEPGDEIRMGHMDFIYR